VPISNTDVK